MRNLFCLWSGLIFCILLPGLAFSQNITLTGTITDKTGHPVPGASIMIRPSSRGTVSDMDGKFKISAPPGSSLAIQHV